jgi:hypothetical protein
MGGFCSDSTEESCINNLLRKSVDGRSSIGIMMALQIGRAIGRGIRRVLNPVGLVLMVLTLLYTLVFVESINTIVADVLPAEVQEQAQIGLTFPLSSTVAGILIIARMLIGTVILLAATRAFTRDPGERSSLSADLFTHRIGRALVSAIVANIRVFVAVTIGFVLLFVPGLFLLVSFTLVIFAIGVEDAGSLAALRRSWDLASGNRWRLFALVLIVGIATGILSGIGSVVSIANPAAGQIFSLVIFPPLGIMSYGIGTREPFDGAVASAAGGLDRMKSQGDRSDLFGAESNFMGIGMRLPRSNMPSSTSTTTVGADTIDDVLD